MAGTESAGIEESHSTTVATGLKCNIDASARRQWTASGIASLGMWSFGSVFGWSSPTVAQLESGQDIVNLSKNEISWAVSLILLAALPGCFIGGYLSDKYGRRRVCLSCAVPSTLGWVLIAFANSGWMLILGRIVVGLIGGICSVSVSVYSSEIAEDRLRSKLASWNVVSLCLGILYAFIVGTVVGWRVNTLICGLTLNIMLLAGIRFLPESPRFLVTVNDHDQAGKSLLWLRAAKSNDEVRQELEKIIADVQLKQANGAIHAVTWDWPTLKPVLIAISAGVFCQLSGTTAVTLYTKNIFESSGSNFDPSLSAILVCGTQAVGTACGGLLMTRFGRRPLFIFSEIGMGLSLLVLGLFYYLKDSNSEFVSSLQWLPLFALVGFTITYCTGAGILPWTLMADLCPPHVKGTASAFCTGVTCLLGFLVGLMFPGLVAKFHSYGTFWMFASINFIGGIYMYFVLPETKDKTMDEIIDLFKK